jgi:5-hydroxyisourate hydrolase
MGRLTTHVLDTALGKPAAGLTVELFKADAPDKRLATAKTNADGRLDAPLLEGPAFEAGIYELHFHVGSYLRSLMSLPETPFLDIVPIRFGITAADQHYHVPLLISPYGYATYRGS